MGFRVQNIYYEVSLGSTPLDNWKKTQDWKGEDIELRHRPNNSLVNCTGTRMAIQCCPELSQNGQDFILLH